MWTKVVLAVGRTKARKTIFLAEKEGKKGKEEQEHRNRDHHHPNRNRKRQINAGDDGTYLFVSCSEHSTMACHQQKYLANRVVLR